jgi:hypothetical protein
MVIMKLRSLLTRRRSGGFSLAEAMISVAIGGVAVAGGMTLCQHELCLVKSMRESNAASLALEERIEQLRLVNWRQMTNAAYLVTNYFPNLPKSRGVLDQYTERVTVMAFPDASACAPLIIERQSSGSVVTVNSGTGLDSQHLAQVNVRVTWRGKDSRVRVRELASIISNAGINRNSLPITGASSGSGTSTSTGTTSTTSTGTTTTGTTGTTTTGTTTTGTTSTGTTSTGTTTTGTTTTTTTTGSNGNGNGNANGNGNGNGNGQGNVAGKSGTK